MELKVLGQDNQLQNRQPSVQPSSGGCASTTCGSSEDAMGHLPQSVREKVHNHPCYSEEAHHFYARMHVAVAPACNIQCHFCNRKYDCANESRPGVVSELLTPDQAAKKVLAVASEIPQMTVLGVAGPGDPLANPERTFETFRKIVDKAPDIKLCLSTNGLALPDHVDEIVALNVDHVTITINCVDPQVGAKIYPWVFWNHKRVKGVKGAKILIERQQKGLEMLVERGVLVKVNSVLIPGVNDEHLAEVSRIIKAKGAFLHNVMPLISEPEHGTFYGLMGQRGPNKRELSALQDACAGDMNMMRHCRQCRADAVGLLGEDRGQEFTLDKIEAMDIDYEAAMEKRVRVHDGIEAHRETLRAKKAADLLAPEGTPSARIAVTTKGGGIVNQHFGHATEFLVYEVSPEGIRLIGPRKVNNAYCVGPDVCPEGAEKGSVLDGILDALADCSAVVSAKVGIEPWAQLEDAGILPSGEYAMDEINDALKAMYAELVERGHVFKDLNLYKAAG